MKTVAGPRRGFYLRREQSSGVVHLRLQFPVVLEGEMTPALRIPPFFLKEFPYVFGVVDPDDVCPGDYFFANDGPELLELLATVVMEGVELVLSCKKGRPQARFGASFGGPPALTYDGEIVEEGADERTGGGTRNGPELPRGSDGHPGACLTLSEMIFAAEVVPI